MKKLFMIAALFLLSCSAMAQNLSFTFEESKVWSEIIAKAKAENKKIFVDCYTDWCLPCKLLSTRVFSDKEVAAYFNATFINVKFEMEKDTDAVAMKKEWKVQAYPTLLFIDPFSGEIMHRLAGMVEPQKLIEEANTAFNPDKNFNSAMTRYNNGERSPEFMAVYLKRLREVYMPGYSKEVIANYFDPLTPEQMATKENWEMIKDNVRDPLSSTLRAVMQHRSLFYAVAGQQEVDNLLSGLLTQSALDISRAKPINEKKLTELSDYLSGIDFQSDVAEVFLESAIMIKDKAYNQLLAKVSGQHLKLNETMKAMHLLTLSNQIIGIGDTAIYEQLLGLIDGIFEHTNNPKFTALMLQNSRETLAKALGKQL